ncbi:MULTISPECIES: AMP-binding protein [unclassified Wenzhouxiangella]|uniref:AMP-binding protein n=1 Tax=unclassified Wenzhouxiangella TaxID=2613841 RepID=UPI000E327EAE|nr:MULTISPECIES: AMP-binding protein [unclassified Wenzhouxiangella]RFF26562.1 acyl-phosphate glycerol 3-phosphate acyltransferase [Wenzhouxiangella sp. 15181]RFP70391.1 acyl-phosphate glycerol 3-phosphate acyltransferase [Wenzhouxiangella sp. 15190]
MAESRHRRKLEERMVSAVSETIAETMPESRGRHPEVTLDSRLESDLGLDSLTRAELLVTVEERFGVQLPERLLGDADTPRDILDEVMRLLGEEPRKRAEAKRAEDEESEAGLEVGKQDREHFSVPDFETLQEALSWHAREHPDRTYLHWVKGYDDVRPLSFGDLHRGALRVANGLFQHDIDRRDTVALMLPTGHDYFHGFFGALYANAIPVPLYPPMRASQIEEHLQRQASILNNAGARVMITVPEAKKLAAVVKGMVPSLEHVLTPDEVWGNAMDRPVKGIKGDDIAFLQYTSGSTGDPKGVKLSHANLFSNIKAGNEVIDVDQDDVFVSWLPLYHDMGLIGTCLSSLWYGMHLVIMSPLLFITRPRCWLWAIAEFGGTLSPSPNFGYELCLKKLDDEDMEGLDLASWRVAFNGAEAVSPATVERFIDRFGKWGFRPDAMAPVYGLAENCVALTFPEEPREPVIDSIDRDRFQKTGEAKPVSPRDKTALRFVSCGKPVPRHEIRIVDDDGQELEERREGNLQFRGPSATSGYYRNQEKTDELFDGKWLNTGDRGYIADGELYVSGRNTDLIVRAGRNIYPGEIEEAVGELDGVRAGCVAAFASGMGESEGERLIVVAETREANESRIAELKEQMHRIAMDKLGIEVDEIVMARPHTVPKTSSGKLRRNDCRLRYERDELEPKEEPVWRQLARLARGTWRQQARRGLQSTGRWAYSAWAWTALGVVFVSLWILVNVLPGLRLRWQLAHRGARLVALLTGTWLQVDGAERLQELPRSCVIVANHASYVDALALAAAIPVPVSVVAKAELFDVRGLKRFLKRTGVEPVERTSAESKVRDSRRIAERAQGRRLLFFPEGSFDAAPGLRPFHMGAFVTAAVLEGTVVPIALKGTRQKLPADRWNPRPGPVSVLVGEAIEAEGDDWKSAVELRDRARRAILEMSGEPDRLSRES